MPTQLETINRQFNRSFSMMFNPNLSDLYFWHFHPEYELVYIENASGKRHIGEHISTYKGADLVLIGSNIPHLNFDYGLQTDYRKVVVHIKKDYVETIIPSIPEMKSVQDLFEQSKYGLVFKGAIGTIGKQLQELEHLSPIRQYLQLQEILFQLALNFDYQRLHEAPYYTQVSDKQHLRIQNIYAFVDKNYHRKIELKEVASLVSMTKEAFCRYFKKTTKYTFVAFLNRYRISQSKQHLMHGKSISEACFLSGFESLSYFNRIFKKVTGENPSHFKKRYT